MQGRARNLDSILRKPRRVFSKGVTFNWHFRKVYLNKSIIT